MSRLPNFCCRFPLPHAHNVHYEDSKHCARCTSNLQSLISVQFSADTCLYATYTRQIFKIPIIPSGYSPSGSTSKSPSARSYIDSRTNEIWKTSPLLDHNWDVLLCLQKLGNSPHFGSIGGVSGLSLYSTRLRGPEKWLENQRQTNSSGIAAREDGTNNYFDVAPV